ncbi:unnamed protein product, partial [Choristocarpus tenellus]
GASINNSVVGHGPDFTRKGNNSSDQGKESGGGGSIALRTARSSRANSFVSSEISDTGVGGTGSDIVNDPEVDQSGNPAGPVTASTTTVYSAASMGISNDLPPPIPEVGVNVLLAPVPQRPGRGADCTGNLSVVTMPRPSSLTPTSSPMRGGVRGGEEGERSRSRTPRLGGDSRTGALTRNGIDRGRGAGLCGAGELRELLTRSPLSPSSATAMLDAPEGTYFDRTGGRAHTPLLPPSSSTSPVLLDNSSTASGSGGGGVASSPFGNMQTNIGYRGGGGGYGSSNSIVPPGPGGGHGGGYGGDDGGSGLSSDFPLFAIVAQFCAFGGAEEIPGAGSIVATMSDSGEDNSPVTAPSISSEGTAQATRVVTSKSPTTVEGSLGEAGCLTLVGGEIDAGNSQGVAREVG